MTCLNCLELLSIDAAAPEHSPAHVDGMGRSCVPVEPGRLPKGLVALTLMMLRERQLVSDRATQLLLSVIKADDLDAIAAKLPRKLA